MSGMNTHSGGELDGIEHLKQSIRDILTTPIGTRVMRRSYGSRLFELVDAPINRRTIASIYAATAEALRKWEPRFILKRVSLEKATPGTVATPVSVRSVSDRIVELGTVSLKYPDRQGNR